MLRPASFKGMKKRKHPSLVRAEGVLVCPQLAGRQHQKLRQAYKEARGLIFVGLHGSQKIQRTSGHPRIMWIWQ
jgi:hypothetical protein